MSDRLATGVPTMTASAVRVRVPFRRPIATAAGTWRARDAWILRLRDHDGRTGFGEAALHPGASAVASDRLATEMRSLVDAIDAGERPETLLDGTSAPARAGLDAALIGARRVVVGRGAASAGSTIAVNATIGWGASDEMVAQARAAVGSGFATLKLKGGADRPQDVIGRVAAVRDALGPEVRLRLDMNGAWTPAAARAAVDALAPLDLEYVEDPVAPGAPLADVAGLRRATRMPIALDEAIVDMDAARRAVDAGAADVLVVKPAKVGGVRAALEIAELAAAAGMSVVVSTLLETGVGIAAGLAVAASLTTKDGAAGSATAALAHGLGTADLLVTDLLAVPLHAEGGLLATRDLGALALDGRALAVHAIEYGGAPW